MSCNPATPATLPAQKGTVEPKPRVAHTVVPPQPRNPLGAFLTIADVAETLSVSIRTVQRWVAHSDLGAVRLPGGRIRIRQADLDAAVASWHTSASGSIVAASDEAA
jgi:excisionase family DNA binding protein